MKTKRPEFAAWVAVMKASISQSESAIRENIAENKAQQNLINCLKKTLANAIKDETK